MNTCYESSLRRRIFDPMLAAPSILLAYAGFTAFVFLAELILLLLPSMMPILDSFRPYIGCGFMGYPFTIFWAFSLIYRQEKRHGQRSILALLLLLQAVVQLLIWSWTKGATFGSPYLKVSPWQPVWTMLIPCLWIAVLFTPAMNRFCRKNK